jgi:hypothetical protein
MHPSIRHYAIRVDRDDVVVEVPAYSSYRASRIEALRRDGAGHSLRDKLWGAARAGRRSSAPATA